MPVYRYKGVAAGNRAVAATIDADSLRAARAKLRSDGIFPTEIVVGKTRGEASELLSKLQLPALRRVPDLDLSMFSSQLATLISAGVPLVQALSALTEQVERERFKSVVGSVRESVNQGSSLADALAEHPHVFDELYCSMVRAGESSGALAPVLARLADYVESRMDLRNQLINAMIYPAMMLAFSAAVAGVLLVKVIPNITTMLRDMKQELPLATRVVVAVSDIVTHVLVPRADRARRSPPGLEPDRPHRARALRLGRTDAALAGLRPSDPVRRDRPLRANVGDALVGRREHRRRARDRPKRDRERGDRTGRRRREGRDHARILDRRADALERRISSPGHAHDLGRRSFGRASRRCWVRSRTPTTLRSRTRCSACSRCSGPILLVFVAIVILVIILSTLLPLMNMTSAL